MRSLLLIFVLTLGCGDDTPPAQQFEPVDMGRGDTAAVDEDASTNDAGDASTESPRLTELLIEPDDLRLQFGTTLRLEVSGRDQNGEAYALSEITYSIDDSDIATVTDNGVLIGESIGTATLTVASEGISTEESVRVTGRPVARIEVRPTEMTLAQAGTGRITVDLFDELNQLITDPRDVVFTSDDETVATVDTEGLVTGVSAGSTQVTIEVEEMTETVDVRVTGVMLTGIEVTPTTGNLVWQDTLQLDAELTWDGTPPSMAPVITWTSNDTSAATVDAVGLVSAVGSGSATITASVAGFEDTTIINVDFSMNALDAGASHACALMSGSAICWGDNADGQLGIAGGPSAIKLDHGRAYSDISAGGANTCAIAESNGDAWCWGANANLQLGDPAAPTTSSSTPVRVTGGQTFRSVEVGKGVVCGVTIGESLYCWGRASNGLLGGGQTSDTATPALVGSYKDVAIGGEHICAIDLNDELDCWGRNDEGQLGLNTTSTTPVTTPAAVTGGFDFARIALGQNHSCGNTPGGTLLCWGDDSSGQVGDAGGPGAPTPLLTPSPVPLNRVVAGADKSCALDGQGALYCWGSYVDGAIAIVTTMNILEPTATNAALNFDQITMGEVFACGLVSGVPYCWGDGSMGALGGAASTTTPTRIMPF